MINHYLTNITPDSFSGIIFAYEGISNSVVLLNGPTGCKFYHSATSDHQVFRQKEFDPLKYPELWYFGQPRVPCTYLDKRDYVYGSRDKLVEALRFMDENLDFNIIIIVNSPGEALIGDDINSIVKEVIKDKAVITIETPGYSKYIQDGYTTACIEMLKQLAPPKAPLSERKKKKVNILGMSIIHKYYEGTMNELKRLFDLCDIETGCPLCCESSYDDVMNIADADLNVVIYPEYGLETAKYLETEYGMPYFSMGIPPIGFTATEKFISSICEILGCSSDRFTVEAEKSRARAYIHISRINSLTGLPKGAKFAVHGTYSECLAYTDYIMRYFGMVPDSISVTEDNDKHPDQSLEKLLSKYGMEHALSKDILDTDAELVFADANIIAKLKARHHMFSGVEINLPAFGYENVIPKTHIGLQGALMICEQVINGLMY